MVLFASRFQWPSSTLEFASLGDGARDGTAEVVERGDLWILKSPGSFSGSTGQQSERTLTAIIGGVPTLVRGNVFVVDGDLGLRVDELRIGSVEEDASYTSVVACFEHLSSLCSYRHEDGAARDLRQSLLLPAIDGAAEMSAVFPSATGTITLVSAEPVPLEEFETQLAAFQDLLTFAADMPCGRLSLDVTDVSGQVIRIVGREKFAPFGSRGRAPVEHSLRLSGDWAQAVIDRWWAARTAWRPVTQIVAGLRYQPGYIEADVLLSAVAIEALATKQFEGWSKPILVASDTQPIVDALESLQAMNPAQREAVGRLKGELRRTTFRSKVQQLVDTIDREIWAQTRVSVEEWVDLFIRTRNGIAHGAAGLSGGADLWNETRLLRSTRDANWVVLTLLFLDHLGAPDSVIDRTAERLGARYGVRHRDTPIFT